MLYAWMGKLTSAEKGKWYGTIISDLGGEGKIFGTTIQKTFPLSDVVEAIKTSKENPTAGKAIIHPNA